MSLWSALLLATGESVAAQASGDATTIEQITVIGRYPGPPLWKVTRGEHTLWIFGDLSPVPKGLDWDPRNAERVAILDGRYCVTCHAEHRPERTGTMGLSLPGDYCYHCHEDVASERPTHVGLAFDSCASSGCHNFHDNRALYEDFLVQHGSQPWLLSAPFVPQPVQTPPAAVEGRRRVPPVLPRHAASGAIRHEKTGSPSGAIRPHATRRVPQVASSSVSSAISRHSSRRSPVAMARSRTSATHAS